MHELVSLHRQEWFAEPFDIALMIWSWGYPLLIARTNWSALYLANLKLETFWVIYVGTGDVNLYISICSKE